MDRSKITHKLAEALVAVLIGSVMFLKIVPDVTAGGIPGEPDASEGPDNTTYRVKVVSSFETTFTDCYRFDTPDPGDLSIDLLFQVITYRHGQLDTVQSRFKAVSRTGQALSIMFFGEAIDALGQLVGEAVNEFGDTFVFSGRTEEECEAEPPPEELRSRSTVYRRDGSNPSSQ
jgi:hypothetical protein